MTNTSREAVEALARDVEKYRNLPTRKEGAEARDRLAKDGGARAEAALQEKPDE
ncbi:hypothetical protein KZZ07_08255 [Mameliella sp. CS4]|uniref:hypothetical protein n=1 Tax=Mameliella sp. CS4 TaxID=2862329 RepID=UPI001C5EA3BB|nr:hypothetical protein [Mameliella sp. CS4]MBW4982530.1 hypothetical protein [Mameliella sp. CS4]